MIRPVSYAEIINDPNSALLLEEYSAECSMPEIGRAQPQHEMYAMLESTGGFQAFGVYIADELVGFGSVLIHTIPHYGKKIATNESLFLLASSRGDGQGFKLRDVMKQHAKDNGAVVFLWTAPKGSVLSESLSWNSNCRHSNNVFVESL